MVRVDRAQDIQEPVGVRVGLVLHAEVDVVLLAELHDLLENALLLWWIWTRADMHICVVWHIIGASSHLLEVVDGDALGLVWGHAFVISLEAFPELSLARDQEAGLGCSDVSRHGLVVGMHVGVVHRLVDFCKYLN